MRECRHAVQSEHQDAGSLTRERDHLADLAVDGPVGLLEEHIAQGRVAINQRKSSPWARIPRRMSPRSRARERTPWSYLSQSATGCTPNRPRISLIRDRGLATRPPLLSWAPQFRTTNPPSISRNGRGGTSTTTLRRPARLRYS